MFAGEWEEQVRPGVWHPAASQQPAGRGQSEAGTWAINTVIEHELRL